MASPASPAPVHDPPRRAFGSFTKTSSQRAQAQAQAHAQPPSLPAASSSTSSLASSSSPTSIPAPIPNGSTTNPQLLSPTAGVQRTRSTSSASNSSDAFETAATKAQAWLQNWAPRGEGRGREFLSNTLNGVAGVATTVSIGINEAVNKGVQLSADNWKDGRRLSSLSNRPVSFSGTSSHDINAAWEGSALATSPPGPQHAATMAVLPTSKRAAQPANMARLGGGARTTSPPPPADTPPRPSSTSNASSHSVNQARGAPTVGPITRTSFSGPSATPHGPSNLNPYHVRSGSSSHIRSQSFGAGVPGMTSQSLSRSSSTQTGGRSLASKSQGQPYKIGFQPAGVRADRTDDFVQARRSAGEEREKEEGRLGRRWAKLVDLHFNPTVTSAAALPTLPRSPSSSLSLSSTANKRSSMLSIDGALDALKGPREVWRGVKTNLGPGGGPGGDEARKRAAEQAIVKWEDDGEVKKCRICLASFGLSNRKHHCRVCGRIVCSLPPTPPALLAVEMQLFSPTDPSGTTATEPPLPPGTRREKCSLLLVADWKTGRGEQVDEGFVGWMKLDDGQESKGDKKSKRKSQLSISSTITSTSGSTTDEALDGRGTPLPQQPKEVQVKGVRACRECWAVISRKQKIADRKRVTGFQRLYQALRTLQSEIEDLMPDFEEQMDILTSTPEPEEPTAQTINIHKDLVRLLVQYEHLSKRLSSLPVTENSAQSSVQSAVARTSAQFLAIEMVKVQALPKLQKQVAERKRKAIKVLETTLAETLKVEGVREDKAEDVAVILQPLLEQEAQLETMIADANAQRKYEDGRALSSALDDIRAEIAKVTSRAIL